MRILLLPIGLFIIAIVGVGLLQAGLISGGDDMTVDDETWTPDTGSYVALADSNLDRAYYDNDTTVYNTTADVDTLQEQGVDYRWNDTDGTILAVSGGGLDGATEANITYSYQRPTAEEQRIAGMLAQIPRIAGAVLPALAILVLIVFVRGG